MSKKHNNYSKRIEEQNEGVKVENDGELEVVKTTSEPISEQQNFIKGTVSNCNKLNVRERPTLTSNVLRVIECNTQVEINVEDSTDDFYKVVIDGIEGYCMKDFIKK